MNDLAQWLTVSEAAHQGVTVAPGRAECADGDSAPMVQRPVREPKTRRAHDRATTAGQTAAPASRDVWRVKRGDLERWIEGL